MKSEFHGITRCEVGKIRNKNEDAVLWHTPNKHLSKQKDGCLAIVADGMGGLQKGELASLICIDTIKTAYYNSSESDILKRLNSAIRNANSKILNYAISNNNYGRMGSTCTAAVFYPDRIYYSQIGDSRLYIASGETLKKITRDQTIAEQLFSSGIIGEELIPDHPQKHILTQALGISENIKPVSNSLELTFDDNLIFFLCSDGVTNELKDSDLAKILLADLSLIEMDALLNKQLRESMARDNYSYIIITPTVNYS